MSCAGRPGAQARAGREGRCPRRVRRTCGQGVVAIAAAEAAQAIAAYVEAGSCLRGGMIVRGRAEMARDLGPGSPIICVWQPG